MPVTYTNRKGRTYYLCQGVTKKGKPRYFFSREQKDNTVDKIPDGYEIRESVNGTVSLAISRPIEILENESRAVQTALRGHPKARRYREDVKHNQITIYESVGPDLMELLPKLTDAMGASPQRKSEIAKLIQEEEHLFSQFTMIMRFILTDREKRLFKAQRMCFLGSEESWIDIEVDKPIEKLSATLIPMLGTPDFFQLF